MGERYLGRIASSGSSTNNLTTATPFSILPGSKLTLVASAAGRVACDFEVCVSAPAVPTTTTAFGIPISANSVFPTSVGVGKVVPANSGGSSSAVVSFLPDAGAANLDVWVRGGEE